MNDHRTTRLRPTRGRSPILSVVAAVTVLWTGTAVAVWQEIDFESLPFGTVLETEFVASHQVLFSAVTGDPPSTDNAGTPATLVILDTTNTQPQKNKVPSLNTHPLDSSADGDPDLAWNGGWVGGNLSTPVNTFLGKVFCLAENELDTWDNDNNNDSSLVPPGDGRYDVPDDEANFNDRGGSGNLRVAFLNQEVTAFRLDAVDFEPATACCMEFFAGSWDQASRVAQVYFNNPTPGTFSISGNNEPANTFYDATVVYESGGSADNVANRVGGNVEITAAKMGVAFFDRVQINVNGSAAFDTIAWESTPTLATLSSFVAIERAGETVVEWVAAEEIGTAGYWLERAAADGGYARVGEFVAVSGSPIGGSYAVPDPAAVVGGDYVYRLVELTTEGGHTVLGPFPVTVQAETAPIDAWREASFPAAALADPSVSGDDADPDGDGSVNRAEFAAGTVPTSALSALRIVSVASVADGGVELRWTAEADRTYRVERAASVGAAFEPIAASLPAVLPQTSYTDSSASEGSGALYRIALEP